MGDAPQSVVSRTNPAVAGSWVLYDVANTVYSATVTFLLAPYVARQFNDSDTLGITQTVSMVVSGLGMLVFSALSDRTGKSVRYMVVTTLLCVVAMAGFGIWKPVAGLTELGGLAIVMMCFAMANFGYQSALVFYSSLLPSVASEKRIGLVSGLGVGLGYLGTLLTLVVLLPAKDGFGAETAFMAAAAFFLIMALPCFFLVKEKRVLHRDKVTRALLKERALSVVKTVSGLRRDRNMAWFLAGNFLAVDVLNTAILFFAVYSLNVFDGQMVSILGMSFDLRTHVELGSGKTFQPGESGFLMLLGVMLNGLALAFGILLGTMADKWGSLKSMRLSVAVLAAALLGAAVFAGNGFTRDEAQHVRDAAKSEVVGEREAKVSVAAASVGAKVVAPDPAELAEWRKAEASGVVGVGSSSSSSSAPPAQAPVLVIERPPPVWWLPLAYLLSIGVLGSMGLAGIWTAGRKVLIDLAPRDKLGEYFGLYGITIKLSVIGSTVFGLLMQHSTAGAAMLSQMIAGLIGLAMLMMVKMPKKPGMVAVAVPVAAK